MRHIIYPEATVTVTASSEDANYPATNLTENDYRKKVWKAVSGTQAATLRCAISGTAEVIALYGTNAETAICAITLDSAEKALVAAAAGNIGGGLVSIPCTGHSLAQNDVVLINGTTNYDGVHTLPTQAAGDADHFIITDTFVAETFEITDTVCEVIESTTHDLETATQTYDQFWQEYTEQTAAHTATIILTAGTGETVEAGIVKAGDMVTLVNPQYGVDKKPKSFSIKKELRNGALYTKAGEVVKEISYSMIMTHAQAEDVYDLFKNIDPDPFAMLIADSVSDDNLWAFFGAFNGEPSINFSYPTHADVSVSFLEAV